MNYQIEYDYELYLDEPLLFPTIKELVSMISFDVRFGTVFSSEKAVIKKIKMDGEYFSLWEILHVIYKKQNQCLEFQLDKRYKEAYEITTFQLGIGEDEINIRKSNKQEFEWILSNCSNHIYSDQVLQTNLVKIHLLNEV
ncbi:hypothetical protein [Enterococcus sp. DIV0996a]|uniref:hypothetical protein n=1 Tax=unclassified Enterococcus TaxID=2608891 RepID=UPI0037B33B49